MWPSRPRGTALPSPQSSPRLRGTWGRGTQGRGRTHCDRGSECSPGPGHAGWAARKGFTSPMPMSPNSVTDKATWAGATTSSASPFTSTRLARRGSSSGRAPGRAKSAASLGLLPGSGGAVAGGQKAGSTRPGGRLGRGTAGGASSCCCWNGQGPGSEGGRLSELSPGSPTLLATLSTPSSSARRTQLRPDPRRPGRPNGSVPG